MAADAAEEAAAIAAVSVYVKDAAAPPVAPSGDAPSTPPDATALPVAPSGDAQSISSVATATPVASSGDAHATSTVEAPRVTSTSTVDNCDSQRLAGTALASDTVTTATSAAAHPDDNATAATIDTQPQTRVLIATTAPATASDAFVPSASATVDHRLVTTEADTPAVFTGSGPVTAASMPVLSFVLFF
jgi:hypothetical protein